MLYALGVVLFALGILASVCLHEAGHMLTAKKFGMKVTQYFVGFGPTLWSFHRGETEYGVKALPFGGFVKIVGMTPLEDDIDEADQPRAFWRQKVWKRTIVLSAGSLTHFVLGLVLLFLCAIAVGLPNPALEKAAEASAQPVIGVVAPCVVTAYELGPDKQVRECRPGDPVGPARTAGLRAGDRVTSLGGKKVSTWEDVVAAIRGSKPGPIAVSYVRDGRAADVSVNAIAVQRPPLNETDPAKATTVAAMGVAPRPIPNLPATVTYGPGEAVGQSLLFTGRLFTRTFAQLGQFPQKLPRLIDAIEGKPRDPNGPIGPIGASRLGGEAIAKAGPNGPMLVLLLLASLNIFIGIFNLFPLLPLDGGHIAIVWFERVRSWWAQQRGRPDPGRVDYGKLMPVTVVVILVFGSVSLLAMAADIVNPVRLFP